VSFDGLLIHTAEVYRRPVDAGGNPQVDRFGQAKGSNPGTITSALATTYPCRCYPKSGGFVMQERAVDVLQNRFCVLTGPDADIYEDDSLRIVDANGHEITPKTKVSSRDDIYDAVGLHHLEFELWVQTGPGN